MFSQPLADELDRHGGLGRAIDGLSDPRGEDLGLALDVQVRERLLDDAERVPPVLEAQRRVPAGDGNGIPEIQERIQPLRSAVPEREDVSPAEQIDILERDDASLRPDGGRLVVVEVEVEAEGLPILDQHVEHAVARPEAGLEVHPEALDPRIVEEQLDLALQVVDVERLGGRESSPEVAGPKPPVPADVELGQTPLDHLVGDLAIADGLVGEDHARVHEALVHVELRELASERLEVLLGQVPVLVGLGDLRQDVGGEGGAAHDVDALDEHT